MDRDKGQASYNSAVGAIEALYGKGTFLAEAAKCDALGKNMLQTDLEDFGKEIRYSLSDETRDRLIAHTRQDAAASYGLARAAFLSAYQARATANRVLVLACILLGLNLLSFFL